MEVWAQSVGMTESDSLEEKIREEKGSKDSTDDMVKVVKYLWREDYVPGSDGIKKSELTEQIKKSKVELDYSLGTSLQHLRDIELVRRWIKGPQILVIHDDRGVINGEDLEQVVIDETESLINAIQNDEDSEGSDSTAVADGRGSLRDVVADALEVDLTDVEDELRTGEVPDRMSNLEDAIDAIERSDLDKNGEYHRVFFIHNPYRYSLTAKAVDLCS